MQDTWTKQWWRESIMWKKTNMETYFRYPSFWLLAIFNTALKTLRLRNFPHTKQNGLLWGRAEEGFWYKFLKSLVLSAVNEVFTSETQPRRYIDWSVTKASTTEHMIFSCLYCWIAEQCQAIHSSEIKIPKILEIYSLPMPVHLIVKIPIPKAIRQAEESSAVLATAGWYWWLGLKKLSGLISLYVKPRSRI